MRMIPALVFIFWTFFMSAGSAEVLLDDSFNNTSQVDLSKTDAEVDTSLGEIRLPLFPLTDALAANRYFGDGYAVTTQNAVQFYAFDSASSSTKKTMEIPVSNPLAVSLLKKQMTAFVMTDQKNIYRFELTENGVLENPYGQITGSNIISIAAMDAQEGIATIDDSGKVDVYLQKETEMGLAFSFATGLTDPVSISVVPNTIDLVVSTTSGMYFYPSDGSGYTSPIQILTGVNGLISAEVDENGNVIASKIESGTGSVDAYLRDDASATVEKSVILSQADIDKPIAVSLNTDIYEQAYATRDGEVHYLSFDGTKMVELQQMSQTGLAFTRWYQTPKYYYSNLINAPFNVDYVRLTTEEANETGGTIQYEISTDGITFQPLPLSSWTEVAPGNQIILKANLDTSDRTNTPILRRVQLEVSALEVNQLTVTKQFYPGDNQTDPTPTTSFPVYERAGGQVEFTVNTTGGAERVTVLFSDGSSMNMVAFNPVSQESNTWIGWYSLPVDMTPGQTIGVTVAAERGSNTKSLDEPALFQVDGSVTQLIKFQIVD